LSADVKATLTLPFRSQSINPLARPFLLLQSVFSVSPQVAWPFLRWDALPWFLVRSRWYGPAPFLPSPSGLMGLDVAVSFLVFRSAVSLVFSDVCGLLNPSLCRVVSLFDLLCVFFFFFPHFQPPDVVPSSHRGNPGSTSVGFPFFPLSDSEEPDAGPYGPGFLFHFFIFLPFFLVSGPSLFFRARRNC